MPLRSQVLLRDSMDTYYDTTPINGLGGPIFTLQRINIATLARVNTARGCTGTSFPL